MRERCGRLIHMLALVALFMVGAPLRAALPGADLPMTSMPLHDPWIVADPEKRVYHLFTRNEPSMTGDERLGIMVYTSDDLRLWTRPKMVFALPAGVWAKDGAWAPEIHPWQGRWYMFATFHDADARLPATAGTQPYRRSTILAVADRPDGPFSLVRDGAPVVPPDRMTLDGTLFVQDGRPWMVYSHEWLQTTDGTIEAVPLNDDLSAAGPPRLLFRASEAPWVAGQKQPDGRTVYVTDGPELFRTEKGVLLMLWSSYGKAGYVQGLARSKSGRVEGPWEQVGPLVGRDSGHGMLFRTFDGRLMMVLHRPFKFALGKLYEMRDTGDSLEVVREATELDGEAYPTHPCLIKRSPTGAPMPDC